MRVTQLLGVEDDVVSEMVINTLKQVRRACIFFVLMKMVYAYAHRRSTMHQYCNGGSCLLAPVTILGVA